MFLVVTDEIAERVTSADQAAALVRPVWDQAQMRLALTKLEPGDTLDAGKDCLIVRVTEKVVSCAD